MKSVLISIQPRWVEKIASGEKTIEVRKTAPKCGLPFKGYIYCTIPNYKTDWGWQHRPCLYMRDGKLKWIDVAFENITFYEWAHQKVIGEFVCDRVIKTCGWRLRGDTQQCAKRTTDEEALPELACLTIDEIVKYAGSETREVCGWHISDLKIYDKPKDLSEFKVLCNVKTDCHNCPYYNYNKMDCDSRVITRPPQSWQYVEELEE